MVDTVPVVESGRTFDPSPVFAGRPCSGFLPPCGDRFWCHRPRLLSRSYKASAACLLMTAAPPWTCSRTAPGLQLNPTSSRWHAKAITTSAPVQPREGEARGHPGAGTNPQGGEE